MNTNRPLLAAVLGVALALTALPGDARAAGAPRGTLAPRVLAAAPVGKLAPSGCVRSGTEATCDLWAKPGTAQVLGQPLPIWGYAGSDADPATAPGPVLVVQQGDHVSVTLHNGLGRPTSLAFPGQPSTSFDQGQDSTTGVDPGASTTYTFTATRPGTFLYEAGHTADGARQVAMGLAGALVVLPSDPSGAYGTAATAYDDEAVLVLSDVDPRFNTAPLTFDMRNFRARYRLINGKAFPSTDPIGTDQGHTVLLRYVNAGASPHPMGLLGADQTEVAQDGHPLAHPTRQLVADLQPGATMDTLVQMPSGPGSNVTLAEQGGHLDNFGQTQADPTRLAFGGMMTFLDTSAPPDPVDAIGPVPAHVKVSPNPADGLADVTVTADLSDATTGGNPVDAAELVVDDARTTGVGFGTPMTLGGSGVSTTATGVLPAEGDCTTVPVALSCLAAGKHRVFVRGRDSAGNWGVIGMAVLRLPKNGPLTRDGALDPSPTDGTGGVAITATGDDSTAGGTIDGAEYFVDDLGAPGEGLPLAVNKPQSIVSLDATIPAADLEPLAEGVHHVLVRSHDDLGLWGPVLDIPLVIDRTGPVVTAAAVMPNPSNGELDDPGNPGNVVVSAQVQDAASGGDTQVVAAEGFLDPGANPQPGAGFDMLAVDGKFDSATEAVYGLIPVSEIHALDNGDHVVRVRAQDAAGNWGDLFTAPLTVDRTAPTLGALTATPNPTAGAASVRLAGTVDETSFGGAEVFLGNTDPGPGNATPIQLSVAGGSAAVDVPVPPFTFGFVPMNVRVQDLAGNWSNTQTVLVRVTRQAAGPAGLLGFGGSVGRVAVSSSAAIARDGDQRGVTVTLPGAGHGSPAYVRAASRTAVDSYRATFSLAPHSLRTSHGGPVTLFQGSTRGGKGVFAVQLRSSGPGAQLRGLMSRSTGAPVTGDWTRVSTATHVVTLTWTSGRAKGAGSHGGLQVLVDGRRVFEENGNTRALHLGGLRLGVVSGQLRSASGQAWLDGFSSYGSLAP